ncbi:MAG TPA: HEAT repeat domain-containing protein [Longimicrobium sp.]|nr:HEAT repeat domain-containing protein [Longimicrobium sp.]
MNRSTFLAAAGLALLAAPLGAQGLRDVRVGLADARQGLAATRLALAHGPPPAAFPQDPADALYRQGREALNRNDWTTAARRFQQIRQQHPRSRYAPDALYWEAWARYRTGRADQLRMALGGLETQRRQHPNAGTRRDADQLALRIRGELARQGDADAAEDVATDAQRAARCDGSRGGDDDERMAALNALLQMDAEQAMPLLRSVLARRDACSEALRSKAVFLVAQKAGADAETLLLNVARTDPSTEVRGQAVFWLSQTGTERSLDAIEQILRTVPDADIQEKAVFALSQHRSPRAAQLLRAYAERDGAPANVREKAIFWLGQRASAENAQYLRALFGRLRDEDLKEKVIFSLSQMSGFGNERWLMSVALDAGQPTEIRKKALFWAGQAGVPVAEVAGVYDRMRDADLREQIIFVLSQRMRETAAMDKIIDIARRDPDRRMREKALFWLSQSRDPRAGRVIREMIEQ